MEWADGKCKAAVPSRLGDNMRRARFLLPVIAVATLLSNASAFAASYYYCRLAPLPYNGKNPTYFSDVFGPLPSSINHDETTAQAAISAFEKFVSGKYNVKGSAGCAIAQTEAQVREELRRDEQTVAAPVNGGKAVETGWKFSL
jgi:hypothetical protein